jgi:FkbM family methyltransferase
MELETGKLVDEIIIKTGIWEKGVSEIIKMYLKQGDTFIDIGANIWYDTLLASMLVGEEGHVFSFEPSTKNFDRLQRNIQLNKLSNIDAYNIWVGDKKETLLIYYNDFNPGETSLVPWNWSASQVDEKVNIDTLDNLLQDKQVDFIKMDIEWFEPRAIRWMKKIIQTNPNMKMVFEFSPFLYGSDVWAQKEVSINLLTQLQDYWFDLYYITENNNLSSQKIIDCSQYCMLFFEWNARQADIFCMKKI